MIGLPRRFFLFTYLGVPIFYGRVKSMYFEFLVDKVRHALEGWNARVLSFGGRITLIKSVLQSCPTYILSSFVVPKSILHRLESLMAQFLWNARGEVRAHWVNWRSICYLTSEGGLGFRRLEEINETLHAKLLWLRLSGDSLWAHFVRSEYMVGDQPIIRANASPLWRDLASLYTNLHPLTRWIVGVGRCRFWLDNWTGEILHGPQPVDATLTIA